jgi:hypothetical protein
MTAYDGVFHLLGPKSQQVFGIVLTSLIESVPSYCALSQRQAMQKFVTMNGLSVKAYVLTIFRFNITYMSFSFGAPTY